MSVSRSGSILSPYYVYKVVPPTALGFGSKSNDNSVFGVTMAASSSIMIASSLGTNPSTSATRYNIWYTSDAKNWTRSSSSGTVFGTNPIYSMVHGNGIFVAVGDNATIGTSTDGATWTARTKASSHSASAKLKFVHYLNGSFFIWDENGVLSVSSDGITWSSRATLASPLDGGNNGGSATMIYNSSNSTMYAFPDKFVNSSGTQILKYALSTDNFVSYSNFDYHQTNGNGARFVHGRTVNGNMMFIGTHGRSSTTVMGDMDAHQIGVALTTVDANLYANTAGVQDTLPAIWPTTNKVPDLTTLQFTSNAAATKLPAITPDFGGPVGSQNGFFVNYENGYWNLIGNVLYQYSSSNSTGSLGCQVLRWKDEEGELESLYSVDSGARWGGTSTVHGAPTYNFQSRTTQTNGGNEVVFKDVSYTPVQRGSGNFGSRDIIVGRRKIITRNQL